MTAAALVGLALGLLVNRVAEGWPRRHPLTAAETVPAALRWLQRLACLLVPAAAAASWLQPGCLAGRLLALAHVALLGIAGAIDLAHRRIYLAWSATALLAGALTAILSGGLSQLAAGLLMFGLTAALWRFSGQLGGGDVWLATYLGLLLGPVAGPLALLIGSLAGALVGGLLMLAGRLRRDDPLPAGFFWAWSALGLLASPGLARWLLPGGVR